MVQIRLGNFGNVTPGRAPVVNPPALNQTARAVSELGQTAFGIATDMRAQETRLAQQELAEQRAQAEAAERAREGAELNRAQDRLRDLHDEIGERVATGELPRDQAETEFTTRAKEAADESMQRMRPETRPIAAPRIDSMTSTLGNSLRRTVAKRAKQEVTGSITESLEYFQRLYVTDPQKATEGAMGTISALGPWSDMTLEQRAKLGQVWKERTQYTAGFEAVSKAREDRKGLAAAEQFIGTLPDLDPQQRAQLIDRAQAYRMTLDQKADAAAARAERERERVLTKAQHEFNAFQALADKGTALSPEYVDRAIKATAGTPYAGAIKGLAEQARVTGGLASQPIAVQQAMLDQVNAAIAQGGRSPELDKRKEQIEKVVNGSRTDVDRDPLRAGLERGVITELPPLAMTGGIEGIVQQLGDRVLAADRVRMWSGKPASPLTSDEAANFGRMLAALPAEQRGNAVAMVAATVPPQQAQALARQIDQRDKALALALAVGTDRTTQGRTTAELILRGAQAVKDRGIKEETAAETGLRARLARELGDAVPEAARADVIDAARFIYLGKMAAGESVDPANALRLATGGTFIEHNGRRLPVPAGVDLPQRLESLPESAIASQAPDGMVYLPDGRPMRVPEFLGLLPGAQLEPVGLGKYLVRSGGALVVNSQRSPIVLDVVNPKSVPSALPPGMTQAGNIDVNRRPVVRNSDGTISTISSISANIDGAEVLLPTISPDGKRLTDKEAIERFRQTGEHLGKFASPKAADAYARDLSERQGATYGAGR